MTQNKKLVSVIVIVALLGASVAPICGQGYSGSPVSRGLVAYYPFEGNADDQSGNGNHGTNNGATFVSGVSGGRALELDGKADYVLAPVNINPDVMPQLTMTAWVRPDTASGVVMSVDNGGYDRSVHVDNRGGGTGWSAFSGSGGVLGYSPVTIDEWVFLAVVYDQDAETVKLYVNDRVYEEQGRLGSGWEDTYIGKSPSVGAHFSGSIDEVRIYNYALTQSEIKALYTGGTPPTPSTQPTSALPSRGLVAYYPFEGNADDQSGNGNHGTNNGATFVSGISGGRALELDGKADYVLAPVNINPEVMPQLTMTAWVRPDTASGVVMSVDNGGYDRSVHVDNRGGGTGWSAFSGSGGVLGYSPVTIDEWVFLAVVYDQDAGTVKLYVNDQLYEEQGSLGSGWEDTYIGKSPSFGAHFSGSIDEVRIYSYALSQSEIKALYAGGTTPSVTASPTPSTQPTSALPSRGLVAYYPFEGNADDQSGNGNHGTNNGATFVSGVSGGRAVQFDGNDDYVLAPVNINPSVMPQLTMTMWVRADKVSGTVISHDNGDYDRTIDIDQRGGGTGWSAFSGSGGVLGYSPITIDEWVFLAVVYDQDAETVKLYVNDQVYEEKGSLGSGWDSLNIGKNPSFGSYFSGSIDEVRIYSYALSASEIKTIYEGSAVPPTLTPTPASPQPTVTPTGVVNVIFESRSKPRGSTVQIPLTLTGATDNIGNMDITLSYDSSVLEATEVIKGGLTTTSLFDYNILDGTVKISFADEQGFSGDGSIAYVRFTVIGSEGSSSPLRIVSVAANRADDMAPVSITTQDGLFTVLGFEEGKGDCTGDGKITAADALCALEMAVGKIPEDLVMDVNGDGKVTSLDAREILQQAVEKGIVIQGKLEAFDTDNDGTDDKWRYTFDEVEIEDGLYEGEVWDFELTESEIRQMFTIRLENRGDKDYTGYTYRLELPKEFAESVDDIEFSIAPDRIINPDAEVEYDPYLGQRMVWELVGWALDFSRLGKTPSQVTRKVIANRAKVKGKGSSISPGSGSSTGPGSAPPVSPATSPTSSTPTSSPRPPCGDYGQDCCPDETGAKTICYEGECQGGKCIHCGSWGEPCCAGRTCIDYDSKCIGGGRGVCFHESDDCGHVGYRPCSRDGDLFCYDGVLNRSNNICLACGDYYQPCCQYTDYPCDYGNCSNPTYPYTDGTCLPTPGPTQMVFPSVSFKGPVSADAGNYYPRDAGTITLSVSSTGQFSGNWKGSIMIDGKLRNSYDGTFSGEVSHPASMYLKDVEGTIEIKEYDYAGKLKLTRSGKMYFWGGGITPATDASGTITSYTANANIRIDTNGDGRWDNDLFTWESE